MTHSVWAIAALSLKERTGFGPGLFQIHLCSESRWRYLIVLFHSFVGGVPEDRPGFPAVF